MALFKDNELIKLSGDSPEAVDYREKQKWVKENIGFPVLFKRKDSWITKELKNDRDEVFYAPPFIIPNVSSEISLDGDGMHEWRWCPVVPKKKDGEYLFPREFRTSKYDKRMFSLKESEMDKIYFLMFKDRNFKAYYEVDDAKGIANQKLVNKIKEAKINGAFYGENSVLLKDPAKLRQIARAWNVAHIEKMNDAQIMENLEAKVRSEDAKGIRSIDDFLESTQLNEYVKIASIVQHAEDLRVIKYDTQTSCWFYEEAGVIKDKICEVSKQKRDHKYDILRDYLFSAREHVERINSLIGINDIPEEDKLNFDALEDEEWDKVKKYCHQHGIAMTAPGRTRKLVLSDVLKHYKGE